MMKNSSEFSAFTAYSLEDDIIHIEMKKDKKLIAKDIDEIFSCYKTMGNPDNLRVLVSFQGFIPISKEAMEEAKKQGNNSTRAATAYVVQNFALRLGIKFFGNFYKPKYPIYVSSTKIDALKWLKRH